MNPDQQKCQYTRVLIGITLINVLIAATHLLLKGTGEEPIRLMIRWTAKASTFLFAIAFSISSVHFFTKSKSTAKVLQYRPHIGLAFGVFHTFHLFFLIWLQNQIHPVFTLAKTTSLIGGGLAYAFMYLMMISTFPSVRSKMKPTIWKLLHLVGAYWIWLIFFRSYYKQVVYQDRGYVLFTVLALTLLIRMAFLLLRKK